MLKLSYFLLTGIRKFGTDAGQKQKRQWYVLVSSTSPSFHRNVCYHGHCVNSQLVFALRRNLPVRCGGTQEPSVKGGTQIKALLQLLQKSLACNLFAVRTTHQHSVNFVWNLWMLQQLTNSWEGKKKLSMLSSQPIHSEVMSIQFLKKSKTNHLKKEWKYQ